jgi:hypothetical protein
VIAAGLVGQEEQVKRYRVDGEVGRFEFETYRVEGESGEVVDTADLYSVLTGQEWYRTEGFKEIGFVHGTIKGSFRQTATWLNRVRHQPEGTPGRTLSHNSEQEGERLLKHLTQKAEQVLSEHQFVLNQPPPEQQADYQSQTLIALDPASVLAAVKACAPDPSYEAQMLKNPVPYEVAAESVQVSIDPVGVKKQKESREGSPKTKKREMAYQTVAHLQHGERAYILNGRDIGTVLTLILAFLLHNDLLKYNLFFFVDGQRSLNSAILALFAWFGPLQLILDWYHLQEKCQSQLSMALQGRDIRNQFLDQLLPLLWLGAVERAITLLQTIETEHIKNQTRLDELIGYLQRQQPYIPCYAVRKHLGLRNSSNCGEKSNDLLVSARQKHNGMSWSSTGSVALAALTALVRNNEYQQWFHSQTIRFSFAT